jgi:hypothetical protein
MWSENCLILFKHSVYCREPSIPTTKTRDSLNNFTISLFRMDNATQTTSPFPTTTTSREHYTLSPRWNEPLKHCLLLLYSSFPKTLHHSLPSLLETLFHSFQLQLRWVLFLFFFYCRTAVSLLPCCKVINKR